MTQQILARSGLDLPNRNDNPGVKQSLELMSLITHSGLLEVRDRYFHLRRYPSTFLGSQLVDLITDHYAINRNEAVRLGQRLLALELIAHVSGEHDFKDEPLFYVIRSGEDQPELPRFSLKDVRQLTARVRSQGGIMPGVRRRWFVDYPMCFSGTEMVDWICSETGVCRSEAVSVGRTMLGDNLIRHVLDDQPFNDGNHFYRFV